MSDGLEPHYPPSAAWCDRDKHQFHCDRPEHWCFCKICDYDKEWLSK